MKKTILLLIVVILVMGLLTACGNDKKELASIVEDMQSTNEEWMAFWAEYSEEAYIIETGEELNAFYAKSAEEAGEFIEKYKDLEDRLDAIEDGIPDLDYTTNKATIEAYIISAETAKESMEAAIVAE